MNYIVSSLFTTCVDPLRNIKWSPSSNIMDRWYYSGEKICKQFDNIQLLVFYDKLDDSILNKFNTNYITFIQVEDCNGYSPHDYRWIIYQNFLENNIDNTQNIFFTDISDVLIKQNPFLNLEKEILYIGDENQTWGNEWADVRKNYFLENLPSFKEIHDQYKSHTFLNAGILGGESKIVLEFLNKIVYYTGITLNKPYDTSDMIIFNYILYKYFPNKKHGFPINSNFWKNEVDREDVWFIHK
jgi:hypothetical protein